MNKKVQMEVIFGKDINDGNWFLMFTPDDLLSRRTILGNIFEGRYDISTSIFTLEKADKAIIDGLELTGEIMKTFMDRRGFYDRHISHVQLFTTPDPMSEPTLAVFACIYLDCGDYAWIILKSGSFINEAWWKDLKIEITGRIPGGENMEYPASATINFKDNGGENK